MLTHARARSMALSCSGAGTVKSARVTRRGCFCFDFHPQSPASPQLIIDARVLTREEEDILRRYARPEKACEIEDAATGKTIGFVSPYNTKPAWPGRPGRSFRVQNIPIFHLLSGLDWIVPAALLDIRPVSFPRQQAIEIFCQRIASSNHERLAARDAEAQASR